MEDAIINTRDFDRKSAYMTFAKPPPTQTVKVSKTPIGIAN